MKILTRFVPLFVFGGLIAACGQSDPPSSNCATDDDCASELMCIAGSCVDSDGGQSDVGDVGTDIADTSADVSDGGDTDIEDGSDVTTDTDQDTDATDDGSDSGDVDPDANPNPTLADYRPCSRDSDCPVGLGSCITDVTLNRRDSDGTVSVPLNEIDPNLASEGICSADCSASATACDALTLTDSRGRDVAYTCQLVYEGATTYPNPWPDFPFDGDVDADEMAAGIAFGAICRPPFGLSPERDEMVCAACEDTSACGDDSICWSVTDGASDGAAAVCMEACAADNPCSFGFECMELLEDVEGTETSRGSFCYPIAGTCGDCRDLDGDFAGVGRCGTGDNEVSAVDCDDADAETYYSATNPAHAFPDMCAEVDTNCNGLADDFELIGPEQFGEEHCTACFVGCSGVVDNGTLTCGREDDAPTCRAVCDAGFADCDGDPDNGCEIQSDDGTLVWAPDEDGDGRGDASAFIYACTPEEVPAGHVNNAEDCDDARPTVFGALGGSPAGEEFCDLLDNDCDDSVDESPTDIDIACNSGLPGVCADGLFVCDAALGRVCSPTITPGSLEEVCDADDNDCDGETNEVDDLVPPSESGLELGQCLVSGALGTCEIGAYVCAVAGTWSCEQTTFPGADPIDDVGIDSNCDGFDGDVDEIVFVRPGGIDGNPGTREDPMGTIAGALGRAVDEGRPTIIASAETFTTDETIVLRRRVDIYGGYNPNDDWSFDPDARTRIVVDGPAVNGRLVGMSRTGPAASFTLSNIDFVVAQPDEPGADIIAMVCQSCTSTTLQRMSFDVANATAGTIGAAGSTPDAGENGANATSSTAGSSRGISPCGSHGGGGGAGAAAPAVGAAGANGSNGTGSNRGSGGAGGSVRNDGGAGSDATNGAGATRGTGADDSLSFASGLPVRDRSTAGQSGSRGGGGGGGGGGGNWNPFIGDLHANQGAGGAGGGAGGCGGSGGGPGTNGGSSFGLVITASNGIAMTDVEVSVGNGGAGAAGGTGGGGSAGGSGGDRYNWGNSGDGDGGAGGDGGNGSGGAGGGAGSGGYSVGILRDNITVIPTDVMIEIGNPGAGGTGGTGGPGGVSTGVSVAPAGPAGTDGDDGRALEQLSIN